MFKNTSPHSPVTRAVLEGRAHLAAEARADEARAVGIRPRMLARLAAAGAAVAVRAAAGAPSAAPDVDTLAADVATALDAVSSALALGDLAAAAKAAAGVVAPLRAWALAARVTFDGPPPVPSSLIGSLIEAIKRRDMDAAVAAIDAIRAVIVPVTANLSAAARTAILAAAAPRPAPTRSTPTYVRAAPVTTAARRR